jgi:hypothetical protein
MMEDTNLALGILCRVGTFFVPTRILMRWNSMVLKYNRHCSRGLLAIPE